MTKQELKQKLYERYIQPTEQKNHTYVGIEIEMPIVNLSYNAVDFEVVHRLTSEFMKEFKFTAVGTDENGHIYSAVNKENNDVFSYDCSYNNAELSFGKEVCLNTIHERFLRYYRFINNFLSRYNHILTGMGINPYRKLNNNVPIENGRYKMLYNHLLSYPKYAVLPMHFHRYPNFGMFSSASQVQLDVSKENIIKVINTFNRLEPIKAVLFSNSILLGENENLMCSRDMLWENSTHGINPHNVGMFDRDFECLDEFLEYIASTSIYCVEREGHYINFKPTPLYEYFNTESIIGEYSDNEKISSLKFKPCADDLYYLRTFKFEDLTFRGTIEFRSGCCQPISDVMTISAFHLGLINRIDTLRNLLKADTVLYHNGYTAAELRKLLIYKKLPGFVDENKLYELITNILDLCKDGLSYRNFGEEAYLDPLYERVKTRLNPAKEMLYKLHNGTSISSLISCYADENSVGVLSQV